MATSRWLDIKVGLLIVASVIAVVVMIIVSSEVNFEGRYQVVGHMVNVTGLRSGSMVMLSGIPVGQVSEITSSNDPKGPILVVMQIRRSVRIPKDASLGLVTNMLAGDASLAFTSSSNPSGETLPIDGTGEATAVPGFFDEATVQAKQIMKSVSVILDGDTPADAKRLLRKSADLVEHGDALVKNLDQDTKDIAEILANLKQVTADLRQTTTSLAQHADAITANVDSTLDTVQKRIGAVADKADRDLGDLGDLTKHVDDMLGESRAPIAALLDHLGTTTAHLATITAAIDQGQGVIGQLLINKNLATDVNNVAIDIAVAADELNQHPEQLVLGMSSQERERLRITRERLKMQRAYIAGFGNVQDHDGPPLKSVGATGAVTVGAFTAPSVTATSAAASATTAAPATP
jgi:phospholipid/cholesterol/gamma-HCH transport system substrate-binding protein